MEIHHLGELTCFCLSFVHNFELIYRGQLANLDYMNHVMRKPGLWGFQPGPTQTRLYKNHSCLLDAWNVGLTDGPRGRVGKVAEFQRS